ncbi:MAG: aldehyde dehydrogenase family protein, partial [Anaerolineae bacterium]
MKSVKSVEALLEKLNIQETNFGACSGPDGWIEDRGGRELVSYNPTNGEALARVIQATPAAYQTLMTRANRAFETWRLLPAPRRGQVIRDLGYALR